MPNETSRHTGTAPHVAAITIALALIASTASAQVRNVYDPDGRLIGRTSTGSTGSTTLFDPNGKPVARSTTGINGATVYDPNGRKVGTVAAPPKPRK